MTGKCLWIGAVLMLYDDGGTWEMRRYIYELSITRDLFGHITQ